jgi:hypothetical protein
MLLMRNTVQRLNPGPRFARCRPAWQSKGARQIQAVPCIFAIKSRTRCKHRAYLQQLMTDDHDSGHCPWRAVKRKHHRAGVVNIRCCFGMCFAISTSAALPFRHPAEALASRIVGTALKNCSSNCAHCVL